MKKYWINENSNGLNKIYAYFFLFFTGSLFPFLIVEFYFQDYFTIGRITVIVSVILTLCISLKYLKEKYMRQLDIRHKKIDYVNWTQNKEETEREMSYYFRTRLA